MTTVKFQERKDSRLESKMGLDLKMFEGSVPSDLLCAFCGRVLVQPEMSSCQHAFCSSCLRTHSTMACPRCGTWLETTSRPVPAQMKMRLLDLKIRCDHKCGKILTLASLPEHVATECPNTPIACEYASSGCKMKVRRCQQEDHAKECDYRPIICEACGHKTVFKDLFLHQSRTRCVEARIKHHLIQASRSTLKEVKRHQKYLERQQVRLEQQHRRMEVEHTRRMSTARRQRQKLQNYNTQEENPSLTTSTSNNPEPNTELALNEIGNISDRLDPIPALRLITSRENSNHSIRSPSVSREHGNQPTLRAISSRDGILPHPLSSKTTPTKEMVHQFPAKVNLSLEKRQELSERLITTRKKAITLTQSGLPSAGKNRLDAEK